MGEVWRGFDTLLGRGVALKVLGEPVLADDGFRARVEEEARHVGHLEHPSIVPIYDLGELADGRPFFVMKLIHGQTLAELLAARATPAEDLPGWVEVFEQVCQAVAFAHARGLIHRDLKPSNVMLGELGEVCRSWTGALPRPWRPDRSSARGAVDARRAAPFGRRGGDRPGRIGDAAGASSRDAEQFMVAPEQARGEVGRVGTASDVFGLGGILCVILTGQPPFSQWSQAAVGYLEEAFAQLDGCGADAELIALAKARARARPGGPSRGRRGGRYGLVAAATATRSRHARARRSGCRGSARLERGGVPPGRRGRPARLRQQMPGRSCSAPRWRRRCRGCRGPPAPPRRPPPGRCSRSFSASPCWRGSATRRGAGRPPRARAAGVAGRSGRKSRGSLRGGRTRRDDRPLDSLPPSNRPSRAAARSGRWKCRCGR